MRVFGTADSFVEVAEPSLKLGRLVANLEFLRALLRFGSFDAYHVFCPTRFHVDLVQRVLQREVADPEVLGRVTLSHHLLLPAHLRRQDYDAFHVGGWYFYLLRLAHLRATPGVRPFPLTGVTHSLNGPEVPERCRGLLEAPLGAGDAIVCTSECGREVLRAHLAAAAGRLHARYGARPSFAARLERIPFGVDESYLEQQDRAACRRQLGIPMDDLVLLYLGRISAARKADLAPLLYVFRRLARSRPERLRLVVAGGAEAAPRARLEEVVGELGLADRVDLAPDVDDRTKHALYGAADLYVSPADNPQETFGLSVIEAMAASLPVVASAWNGYRELVLDGETGFLVPTLWGRPADVVTELSAMLEPGVSQLLSAQSLAVDLVRLEERLAALISRPDLRHAMGRKGCARVRARFTWPAVITAYEALWAELRRDLARAPLEDPGGDPAGADLLRLFGGYPSACLQDGDGFAVSELGRECMAGKLPFPRPHPDAEVLHAPALVEWLLEHLDPGPRAWSDLREQSRRGGLAPDLVRSHLLWLLKYGILRHA